MKEWLKNAVFYQLYPQSFCDSNGDGIGDFGGIHKKLAYLKELGITGIWINPCYDSPFRDAGYDIRDYYTTAERYGTNQDLKNLMEEIHKRGMYIMLDLVPGHTSDEHPWFLESQKAEKNKYSDRYVWTDSIKKDFAGIRGVTGWLRGISDRNGCCGINYYSAQPALNYGFSEVTASWQKGVDSPEAKATRQEMVKIMQFWLQMGCDGFRVDMANSIVKADPVKDDTIRVWNEMFDEVRKDFPNAAFVSEWSQPHLSLRAFDMDFLLQFGDGHYLDLYHSQKPYFSREEEGSAEEFFRYYLENCRQEGEEGLICIPSGNHDMPRLSHFCDAEQIKLVYAFMMSMPGVPFIYYGDEIGMKYLPDLISVEGGYERTGSRTPMQWDNTVNNGFSAASAEKLYIPQDDDPNRPTVENQLADENSVLNILKKQIAVRKANPVLQESAGFRLISAGYPLVYERFTDDDCVLVVVNPSGKEKTVSVPGIGVEEVIYSIGGMPAAENGILTVQPCSAAYLRIKK